MRASEQNLLAGKKGLVLGIANEHSIAYGCARAFRRMGAELAITYLNAKAERYVRPLAEALDSPLILPCDVERPEEVEAVFARIDQTWGQLDFLLHAIAFCPREDLHARVVDCSREGFVRAMDVSCYSFIHLARLAEPRMAPSGGCLLTLSYYGAHMVVDHYNIMGPVKAALEGAVRYMAVDLGPRHIRVNAISPGPIRTRAGSGIAHFDELMETAAQKAPQRQLVSIDDVGGAAAFLVSDLARSVTGDVIYVDAGYHVVD